MRDNTKAEVVLRLKSVEGHVRGVVRMVEAERNRTEVIKQVAALRGALDRIESILLAEHLNNCLSETAYTTDPAERAKVVEELVELLQGGSAAAFRRHQDAKITA